MRVLVKDKFFCMEIINNFLFKKAAFDRIYTRLRDAFRKCGYNDLELNPENGGPKPNGNLVISSKLMFVYNKFLKTSIGKLD